MKSRRGEGWEIASPVALPLPCIPGWLAGLVPAELGASEGSRQRGREEEAGQGKGSAPAWDVRDSAGFAGGGWEQQSKVSVTAHSSLQNSPSSRKTPGGSRVRPVLRLPGLRGLCGMRDAPQGGPSPADPPPQMSLPAKSVPSAVKAGAPRCHGHGQRCGGCHRRAFTSRMPAGGDHSASVN